MKTVESATTTAPAKNTSPFFIKNGSRQDLFGAAETEAPFFSFDHTRALSIQRKLTIGQPDDEYEREADLMADKVVQRLAMPDVLTGGEPQVQTKPLAATITPLVQTKCAACEHEEKMQMKEEEETVQESPLELQRKPIFESNAEPPDDETVQRKCAACEREERLQTDSISSDSSMPGSGLEERLTSSKGKGFSIPTSTREQMERAFGADFSDVHLHNDSGASEMSNELGAHAFTFGSNIYFNSGKYDANSQEGNRLLAHELTHVVQQRGNSHQQGKGTEAGGETHHKTDDAQVQGAWYNFSIPFTDYEFDPSIKGIKTAAGLVGETTKEGATWVKDKVVEGAEWIYEKIKNLINAGIDWLSNKFDEIKEFAVSSFETVKKGLGSVFDKITSPLAIIRSAMGFMDAGMLGLAWNALTTGAKAVWSSIKSIVNGLLSIGNGIWNTVSGYITSLFDKVGALLNSRPFKLLPDFLIDSARSLYNKIRSLWETIRNFWNDFWQRFNAFVNELLQTIENFVNRIISYAINGLITIVKTLKEVYEYVKLFVDDPEAAIEPIIDQIATKIQTEAPGKAKEVAREKLDEAYSGMQASGPVSGVIQRQAKSEIKRRTATRDEVNAGLEQQLGEQFGKLDFSTLLWETIKNLFWPPATIKAIGHEFYELWNTDWANAVNSFFMPRNIFDDFSGFFHDIWSNILIVLDFPWALWRRLNSVLMLLIGYITIILILVGLVGGAIAGGPPGALAGAIAGAKLAFVLGEALFLSYILAEASYALKLFLDLFTARQTKDERDRDIVQIAGSTIGMGIAIVVALLFFLLGSLVSRIAAFIKSKATKVPAPPKPEPKPETKPEAPKEEPKPAAAKEEPKPEAPKEEPKRTPPRELKWPPEPPKGDKPPIDAPDAAEWRYQRYVYKKYKAGAKPNEVLPPDEWMRKYFDPTAEGGRPGRPGGPEQVAAKKALEVEGIRIVENVELGGRYPDGVDPKPNAMGGKSYYEVGKMLKEGIPEARERVKIADEIKAMGPNDTVTFVDKTNVSKRVIYNKGSTPKNPTSRTFKVGD